MKYEEIYKDLCICNGIDDGIRTLKMSILNATLFLTFFN